MTADDHGLSRIDPLGMLRDLLDQPVQAGGHTRREQTAAKDAADLLVFADGVEDAGHPELARRSRLVARETLWLLQELAEERSARVAIQTARDRLLQQVTGVAA